MHTNSTSSDAQLDSSLPSVSILLPILASFACILCIPPLLCHIQVRNFAAIVLVSGILVLNLRNVLNALIWPGDPSTEKWKGQGYCDVAIKLDIGLMGAVVGATICLFRQLAIILDTSHITVTPGKQQKRATRLIEGFLCIGLPAYLMAIHYIVQFDRYLLYRTYGCVPSYSSSWLSLLLIFSWNPVLCAVGATYCGMAVVRLLRYRRSVSTILSSSSSITKARYIRLFSLASVLLLLYFPLSIYTIVENLQLGLHPYSWSNVHRWSPAIRVVHPSGNKFYNGFDRWIQVGTGFVLFLFFGLGHEATVMYHHWMAKLNCVHLRTPSICRVHLPTTRRLRSNCPSPLTSRHQSSASYGPISIAKSPLDRELELLDSDLSLKSAH